ncbi:MAG: hypothetical protein RIQ81_176 [Pseudomonadota bacterium]|jgi:ABC-type phosphate transport system permease subunit
MRRLLLILCAVAALNAGSAVGGSCPEMEETTWVNQAPRIITEPASWLLSGAGYLIDGTIYVAGTTTVLGIPCGVPLAVTVSSASSSFFSSDLFRACIDTVAPYVNDKYYDTDLGPLAYKGTKSWRCPQTWHLGLP